MVATRIREWTVDEYHRIINAGILTSNDRVELLNGQIIEMSPQQPPHASTTQRVVRYLDRLLETRAYVRMQLPITLAPKSEPEPDIAISQISPTEYADHHPTPVEIFLLIEVADTTLDYDRRKKAPLYAQAGIPEYWILDLNGRQVYVFRDPVAGEYRQLRIVDVAIPLTMLTFPDVQVLLNPLLP